MEEKHLKHIIYEEIEKQTKTIRHEVYGSIWFNWEWFITNDEIQIDVIQLDVDSGFQSFKFCLADKNSIEDAITKIKNINNNCKYFHEKIENPEM